MALLDSNNHSNAPRSDSAPQPGAIPHDYLARLPVLHAEAARDARLGGFLSRSVQAAGPLMLAGAASLFAGGGTLQSDFVWSVLVLAGIAAMIVNYLRGQPGTANRVNLDVAAADLRAILLYTGFAWGAGAFLALPAAPGAALALAFAAGPALLMAVLLKDEGGVAAFAGPCFGLAVTAALVKHWPEGRIIAPVLLAGWIAVILLSHRNALRLERRAA